MARMNPIPVEIDGVKFEAMPLTVGPLRDLTRDGHLTAFDAIARAGDHPDADVVAAFQTAVIVTVSKGLLKKHPECTPEWVEEHLMFSDALEISNQILAASGFTGKPGDSKGEAQSP